MNKRIPMEEMYPLMAEMLKKDGTVTFTVAGWSMQPMVYNRRDTVTLKKPQLPLKKYDLPFYKMDDGRFILHRVVKVHKDGTYKCQGDNRWEPEDNIRNDQIIGVVKSFNRNGKQIDVDKSFGYWLYTRTWRFLHPFKKYYKYVKKIKQTILWHKDVFIMKRKKNQKISIIEKKYNVDFGGHIANVKKLGATRQFANGYEPSYDMPELFARLDIKNTDALIDLGCGKGYMMYKFADFPFRRIDGLDLSHQLLNIASANLNTLFSNDNRFSLYHTNVLDFDGFDEYNYIYMYNPFPSVIIEKVKEKIKESFLRNPRKITVIYQNPQHGKLFKEDNLFKSMYYLDRTAVYETKDEIT